jgi:hypothetical protein
MVVLQKKGIIMAKVKFSKDVALSYREQGMSHQEISEIMGCSLKWVNSALVGVPKGNMRVPVDDTKIQVMNLVRELLVKLEAL